MAQQQQLCARIKKTSKYSNQAPPEGWFAVAFVSDRFGYELCGNSNYYRLGDVVLGVVLDDTVIELTSGKKVRSAVAGLRLLEDV